MGSSPYFNLKFGPTLDDMEELVRATNPESARELAVSMMRTAHKYRAALKEIAAMDGPSGDVARKAIDR